VLGSQEQRVWDDVQRFWAAEVEEPSRAAPSARSRGRRLSRVPADLPAAVVAGAWITILLVLFGALVAGLTVGVATALGWALWHARPQVSRTRRAGRLVEQPHGQDHAQAGGQALAPAPTALAGRRLTDAREARSGVRTAGDVMNRRPPIADQDTSLWTAWGRLRGASCRHLVVVDSKVRPVGVLEERDLALQWPPGPFQADRIPLRQVVRGQARPQARTGDDVAGIARAMLAARTDAVPVVDDDGRLVGLVTARQWTELVAGHTVR
jgi:CBS domain-containing protein